MSGHKRASDQSTVKNKQVSEPHFGISERIKAIRLHLKVVKFSHSNKALLEGKQHPRHFNELNLAQHNITQVLTSHQTSALLQFISHHKFNSCAL